MMHDVRTLLICVLSEGVERMESWRVAAMTKLLEECRTYINNVPIMYIKK